ncbi:MAG: helix-turn-helix transcriptional regulator [Anaerolineae bacterium]|nr:helix-turn-helix transcriptional regulator [Anaerolineae bacterium]
MAKEKAGSKQPENKDEEEFRPREAESLGAYIRRVRLMRGLNLPDVARALANEPPSQRISHPYLSQIELGQVFQPSRDRLQSLANVLQINPDWLFEKAQLPLQGAEDTTEPNPIVSQIATRAAKMEPTDQQMVLDMINVIVKRRQGQRKGDKG